MPPKAAGAKAESKAKAKAKAAEADAEEEKNRMDKPDREAFDASVAKIQEGIDELQKKQAELAKRIAERSGGKEEFFAKKAELRGQLDEFSKKIDALMEKKTEINKAIGDKRQEGAALRNDLNKMKKSIGYTSEKEIDERISSIEHRMVTESLKLKEEKDLMREIADLKKNRPKVSQMHKMESGLSQMDFSGSFKEQIAQINEEMSLFRDGKKKVQEKMTELMEGRKTQLGDLPDIIAERDAIGKQIADKVAERNVLRDEFRAKEREFRQYMDEQRRIRQEKAQAERAARQAEYDMTRRQREAEKLDEQPHVQEMTLIEQTMLFCKSLVATKGEEKEAEKAEIQHDLGDGMELLVKKEDRDEFYFVPTKAKKSKSKNKGGKTEGGSKPIKHNAETFRLFDQLKLDAPITTDDIPAVLEKLEALLEEYKQKVKDWEVNRDEMKRKILEEGASAPAKDGEKKEQEGGEEAAADGEAKEE